MVPLTRPKTCVWTRRLLRDQALAVSGSVATPKDRRTECQTISARMDLWNVVAITGSNTRVLPARHRAEALYRRSHVHLLETDIAATNDGRL